MAANAPEAADGRQSRTARSRQAICEACLDLVQEGVLQPTADQVARRAGVSRRSIFNHFADLAELYDAVVDVALQRCAPLRLSISAQEPVARRVERLARSRARFLEAIAPFTRALSAQALLGSAADQALRVTQEGTRRQRREVEALFEGELAHLARAERHEVIDAIAATTSPLFWEFLRQRQGSGVARARAVMRRSVAAILRDAGVAL